MKVSRRRMTSRFLSMLASAVLMMGSVAVRASDATPEPAPSPVGCAVWRMGPVDAADLPPECTYSELWRNRWNDCDVSRFTRSCLHTSGTTCKVGASSDDYWHESLDQRGTGRHRDRSDLDRHTRHLQPVAHPDEFPWRRLLAGRSGSPNDEGRARHRANGLHRDRRLKRSCPDVAIMERGRIRRRMGR